MRSKTIAEEKVIFEYARNNAEMPSDKITDIPQQYIREEIQDMPDLSESVVVRHFTRLSYMNYNLDTGMYPLGSCTMKYNPKVMEEVSRYDEFSSIHPMLPESLNQGLLRLIYGAEQYLKVITGLDAFSLQLAAGAHGEFAGMLIAKKYHELNKTNKHTILIPDTAHGTNPASAAMAGFRVINVPSGRNGMIEANTIGRFLNDDVAGIMLTIPNTLGIFEGDILKISRMIHDTGGLVYVDGANFNALIGMARFKDMGVDIVHLNLHKTFATPHGSGGPGAGVIGVTGDLKEFLPVPVIKKSGGRFVPYYSLKNTIGRMISFYGNVGIIIRAYVYMRMMGIKGAKQVSDIATVNANYIKSKLKDAYHLQYQTQTLHEVVFDDAYQNGNGVKTLDIAKRLLDYGFHPPTIYFPLIVHGAIMIEPTETESKDELDRFISAMRSISDECKSDPQLVKDSPHAAPIRRVDEVMAARSPKLVYTK